MELGAAGLQEQPFRTHGRPLVFVAYAAQRSAFEYLERISAVGTGNKQQFAGIQRKIQALKQTTVAAQHAKVIC